MLEIIIFWPIYHLGSFLLISFITGEWQSLNPFKWHAFERGMYIMIGVSMWISMAIKIIGS